MFRWFKKWFIPSEANEYEPHLFRAWPVAMLLLIIVAFFGLAQFAERSLSKSNSLAAVIASVLVDLTNTDRAGEGLHGLIASSSLEEVARLKAEDMARNGYFAHTSPDGKTPWHWFKEAGYSFSYAGENLAVFFGDSADVARAWMESPTHRANIMNGNFTEIGIATAEGFYQGQPTVFVVQVFGTPAVRKPIATITTEQVVETPVVPGDAFQGEVSGESVQVISEEDLEPAQEVRVIQEDEAFIAVRDDSMQSAPSNTSFVAPATPFWQSLIASPQTALSYAYAVLAGCITIALVFLIFFEARIQRPKSIFFAIILLLTIGTLFFFSYSEVAVASVESFSSILNSFS